MTKFEEIAEVSGRGSFFLFTGNFISLILLAFSSIVVARLLGPDNFGLYGLAFVVPSLIVGLIDLGSGSALTRFPAKLRAENKNGLAANMLKTGFNFRLMISIPAAAFCYIFSDFLAVYVMNRPEIGFLIQIGSIMIILLTIFNSLSSSFGGLEKMEGTALLMVMEAVVKIAVTPLLLLLGFSVVGALAGHVISYVIACILGGYFFFRYYRLLDNSLKNEFRDNIRIMLSYGLPIYASSLVGLLMSQSQSIILAYYASNAEIGNFNVAGGLLSLVSVLVFPVAALFPAFSKISAASNEIKSLFKLSVRYASILSIPATFFVVIMSKDVVYTFYGRAYSLAPLFLQLYVLTFIYSGLGSNVLGYLLSGIGETKIVFEYTLMNLLLFLPIALVLSPLYHITGLLIAILTSSLISLVYGLFRANRKIGISLDLKGFLRICLNSALSAVPVLVTVSIVHFNPAINLVLNGAMFLFSYLTLLPLTKTVNQSDIGNIRLLFRKVKIMGPFIEPILRYETKLLSIIETS